MITEMNLGFVWMKARSYRMVPLFIDDHHVLAIGVESQDLIVISPKDMDEMGITAHILEIPINQLRLRMLRFIWKDPVVEQVLTQKDIAYTIEEVVLIKPSR